MTTFDTENGPESPYGTELFEVESPTNSTFYLQTAAEAEYYERQKNKYLSHNKFTNISDLEDLTRLLTLEVMVYRWSTWLAQGFDYLASRVDESGLKNSVREFSVEVRQVKASLGIDRATREKDRGECHDDRTQVLTARGWLYFKDVRAGELVATRSPSGVLEYEPALAVFSDSYDGNLYQMDTNRLNFAVTPHHKMLHCSNGVIRTEQICDMLAPNYNYKLIKTATVGPRFESYVEFQRDGDPFAHTPPTAWTTADEETLERLYPSCSWAEIQEGIPRSRRAIQNKAWRLGVKRLNGWELDKSDSLPKVAREDYARLLGFWLAEGTKRPARGVRSHLSQCKPEGIAWFDTLLAKMGWPNTRCVKTSGEVAWDIKSKGLRVALEACLGGGHELQIPNEVFLSWSRADMFGLLEGLCMGDGSFRDGEPVAYYSTSEQLADDVQRLVAHLGLSGWKRVTREAGSPGRTRANFDQYTVAIRKSEHATYRPDRVKIVPYVGQIYCLTVPNGTLLTRRNGVVLWSGNTLGEYIQNLLNRAKEFGYHRNEEYAKAVTLMWELVNQVQTHDRCDDDERKELDLTETAIIDWVRTVVIPEWETLSQAFRRQQSTWIKEL